MTGPVLGLALFLVVPGAAAASAPGGGAGAAEEPYRRPPTAPLDFRGPGREEPEPEASEVLLGWFGPGDPDHPDFGDYWRGALVGLEIENAAGGDRGRPFRLVPAWSESPWKAGIVDLARLVQERGAWAILGGVDGTTTHLAVQLALKSRFPLLSPGSTDATADHANVPWLFSLPPSDTAIAEALATTIAGTAGEGGLAIAAETDHDSHATLLALRRALGSRGLPPAALVELPGDALDPGGAAAQLLRARPGALVVIARPGAGARVVAAAREAGFGGPILGGPALSRAAFARAAGASAEGVWAPVLAGTTLDRDFAPAYERRWGEGPDAAAALGHDAVRLVAGAIRGAGLNRARIRDALRALAPWPGAIGSVRWDARGRNDSGCALGRWRAGRLVPPDRAGSRPGGLDLRPRDPWILASPGATLPSRGGRR